VDGGIPRLISILALALLLGCPGSEEDTTVNVYGYMVVGHELGDPPLVLSGARFDAYDDAGELLAEGTEPYDDTPGYYRVRDVPQESHVNLIAWSEPSVDIEGDDDDSAATSAGDDDDSAEEPVVESYVPTILSVWTPTANLYAYDGEVFILPYSWVNAFLASVAKAGLGRRVHEAVDPSDPANGGFVVGSIELPEDHLDTEVVVSRDGESFTTLYLDEFGVADGEATGTTVRGWFVVFDIPAGPVDVTVTIADGTAYDPFAALVAEDSCTSLIGLELNP
jgi:hypothetical protein